jgi:hypothetical protein
VNTGVSTNRIGFDYTPMAYARTKMRQIGNLLARR